jgi:hypothetical protein
LEFCQKTKLIASWALFYVSPAWRLLKQKSRNDLIIAARTLFLVREIFIFETRFSKELELSLFLPGLLSFLPSGFYPFRLS